jgi:hypothetical protein
MDSLQSKVYLTSPTSTLILIDSKRDKLSGLVGQNVILMIEGQLNSMNL